MQHLLDAIRSANLNVYAEPSLNNKLVFGIRGQANDASIGDILPVSHAWIDGDRTDNQLSGTCAVKVLDAHQLDYYEDNDNDLIELLNKALDDASGYGGHNSKLYLVIGLDTGEIGNDDFANEVILDDCTIIAKF
jgi:hypothetical protein